MALPCSHPCAATTVIFTSASWKQLYGAVYHLSHMEGKGASYHAGTFSSFCGTSMATCFTVTCPLLLTTSALPIHTSLRKIQLGFAIILSSVWIVKDNTSRSMSSALGRMSCFTNAQHISCDGVGTLCWLELTNIFLSTVPNIQNTIFAYSAWVSSKSPAFVLPSWQCMASSFTSDAYFHATSSRTSIGC